MSVPHMPVLVGCRCDEANEDSSHAVVILTHQLTEVLLAARRMFVQAQVTRVSGVGDVLGMTVRDTSVLMGDYAGNEEGDTWEDAESEWETLPMGEVDTSRLSPGDVMVVRNEGVLWEQGCGSDLKYTATLTWDSIERVVNGQEGVFPVAAFPEIEEEPEDEDDGDDWNESTGDDEDEDAEQPRGNRHQAWPGPEQEIHDD